MRHTQQNWIEYYLMLDKRRKSVKPLPLQKMLARSAIQIAHMRRCYFKR